LFAGKRRGIPPFLLFVARHVPVARWLLPRMIAFGPRPEHAPAFARRVQLRETAGRVVTNPETTKLETMTSPLDAAAARARLLELIKELAVVRGKPGSTLSVPVA
jgi:hypothetical protein